MTFTSSPLWRFENMTTNFCLKYIIEVNNRYATKGIFQISVCACAWFCLRLWDAIVNNVNNINIAKLLITIYCKCQKILWWKWDTSEDAEVSHYVAWNSRMFVRLFKPLVSNGLKFYRTKKNNLGSKEEHLVHLNRCIIHNILSYYTYGSICLICVFPSFFRICHGTVKNLDIILFTS